MSANAWTFIGSFMVQFFGFAGLWLKLHKSREVQDETQQAAEQARDFSRPTGNGFAKHVLDGLEEIKRDIRTLRHEAGEDRKSLVIHLQDHSRVGLYVPRQSDRSRHQGEETQADRSAPETDS